MKKNLLTQFCLFALIAIVGVSWSCTKDSVTASNAQQTAVAPEDVLQASEVVQANVVPGIYSILKFIDTGNDITSDYTGYTFEFKADGTLVATTNKGSVFTGTWKLNTAQTKMAINISGNAKLNNLSDDSWKVVTITDQRITLKKAGPDKVVFVM